MSAMSRRKGAFAEREVAAELYRELGMTFGRNLSQYQKSGQGDLTCDDPDFPFCIEIKRYAKGWTCKPEWMIQAFQQAAKAGLHPAVIYRYDGQKWRVRIWFDAMAEAFGTNVVSGRWMDIDIESFAWVCREIMAWRADRLRTMVIEPDGDAA